MNASSTTSQAHERTGRVAAIYARVSSERQRRDETIRSQTAALRELAAARGLLLIPQDLVFEDEGFSGATLLRPAHEQLRDRAAEGCFEVLLCHAPDRLARRYAYQVLLLEELQRAGVEVIFAKEPERAGTPEDELLRQFQGMIAEYERARCRRGARQRALRLRYVKKSEHVDAFYEIDELEGAGRARGLPPLRRGRRVDRPDRVLTGRAARGDQDRQGGLEPRHDLGHAAQAGLRRAGRFRQDARYRRTSPDDAHRPPARPALRPRRARARGA